MRSTPRFRRSGWQCPTPSTDAAVAGVSTYVIGDIQGCDQELQALLQKIAFNPARDRLWVTGDLVNRGPQSLAVLRRLRQLGSALSIVLGNHDLHLLACRMVKTIKPRKRDTIADVLAAPDCDELLDWLRAQPLLHHDSALGLTMVHAGLAPQWTLEEALGYAAEIHVLLRGDNCREFLAAMYGDEPARWRNSLAGLERARLITNCLTRMRFVTPDGALNLRAKGAPGPNTPDLLPWFAVPGRKSAAHRVVFGHWSTLRLSPEEEQRYGVIPLDTGAVWGGELTAWCVETDRRYRVQGSGVWEAED